MLYDQKIQSLLDQGRGGRFPVASVWSGCNGQVDFASSGPRSAGQPASEARSTVHQEA